MVTGQVKGRSGGGQEAGIRGRTGGEKEEKRGRRENDKKEEGGWIGRGPFIDADGRRSSLGERFACNSIFFYAT